MGAVRPPLDDACVVDLDEEALLAKYKADLAALRLRRQPPQGSSAKLSAPSATSSTPSGDGLQRGIDIKTEQDGSLVITPLVGFAADVEVKAERAEGSEGAPQEKTVPRHASLAEWNESEAATITNVPAAPTEATLGPFAIASIGALKSRNEKKKEAQRSQAKAASSTSTHNKALDVDDKQKVSIMQRPSSNREVSEAPPKKILNLMPQVTSTTTTVPPVHYAGGVIYTVPKTRKFRALRNKLDKYTEKSCTWGSSRTPTEAWQKSGCFHR